MAVSRGPAPGSWSDTLTHHLLRGLSLLLAVAALFTGLRLSHWLTDGQATLIHQSTVTNNTFTTRSLGAPTNLKAYAAGGDVKLQWTAGQNGAGYALARAANGNSNNCAGASYSSLATPGASPYIDEGRDSPPGSWDCYQLVTTNGGWTSPDPNPTVAVQLGFVASSVTVKNGGNTSACGGQQSGVAGDLDCGDQIVLGFNQPVNTGTGPASPDTVCADTSTGTLWLGSAITSGACSPAETPAAGTLTGLTLGGCDCRFDAAYTWGSLRLKLTITIGARTDGSGYPSLGGSHWTYKPTTDTSRLLSMTGGYHVCDNNTDANNCWPATP